jgi:hypothetical protein
MGCFAASHLLVCSYGTKFGRIPGFSKHAERAKARAMPESSGRQNFHELRILFYIFKILAIFFNYRIVNGGGGLVGRIANPGKQCCRMFALADSGMDSSTMLTHFYLPGRVLPTFLQAKNKSPPSLILHFFHLIV